MSNTFSNNCSKNFTFKFVKTLYEESPSLPIQFLTYKCPVKVWATTDSTDKFILEDKDVEYVRLMSLLRYDLTYPESTIGYHIAICEDRHGCMVIDVSAISDPVVGACFGSFMCAAHNCDYMILNPSVQPDKDNCYQVENYYGAAQSVDVNKNIKIVGPSLCGQQSDTTMKENKN